MRRSRGLEFYTDRSTTTIKPRVDEQGSDPPAVQLRERAEKAADECFAEPPSYLVALAQPQTILGYTLRERETRLCPSRSRSEPARSATRSLGPIIPKP